MMQSVLSTLRGVTAITGMVTAGIFVVAWIVAIIRWDGERNCDMDCDACPFPPCEQSTKEAKHGKP